MKPSDKKILIVEDEEPMLRALTDKFTREGFHVFQGKDGEDGLAVALKEQPDIILLDIVMPKMDGLEMLMKLRESDWGKKVPVLLLTNYGDLEKITSAVQNYVVGYLLKTDWKLENVVKKVKETLNLQ